jgi:hypothetical protein
VAVVIRNYLIYRMEDLSQRDGSVLFTLKIFPETYRFYSGRFPPAKLLGTQVFRAILFMLLVDEYSAGDVILDIEKKSEILPVVQIKCFTGIVSFSLRELLVLVDARAFPCKEVAW